VRSVGEIKSYWEEAGRISRDAHQQRMQAIQARGSAAKSVGDTYSDILDISHQGYLSRDSINSGGHSHSVNAIQNTTLIGSNSTGEHYSVDRNNSYYWVNGDGKYIGTDNPLFDPRTNPVTREESWSKFHKEN